jgi:hypothetical protein
MNIKTIAATLLLTSAFLALLQDSLAAKPDRGSGGSKSDKTCEFEAMSSC